MPKILIIEPSASGHRPACSRRILKGAMARGHQTTFASVPALINNPLLALQADSKSLSFEPIDDLTEEQPASSGAFATATREFAYRRLLRDTFARLAEKVRPDVTFIPSLDFCVNAIGLAGAPFQGAPWAGLVMNQSFHCDAMNLLGPPSSVSLKIRQRTFLSLLSKCGNTGEVMTFDETLKNFVDEHHPRYDERIRFIPDPAELKGTTSRDKARAQFGLPPDGYAVLLYGSLRPEKGVEQLLDAFASPEMAANTHLLLIGRQQASIKRLMRTCLLYTSPSPRDATLSRMPSSA